MKTIKWYLFRVLRVFRGSSWLELERLAFAIDGKLEAYPTNCLRMLGDASAQAAMMNAIDIPASTSLG